MLVKSFAASDMKSIINDDFLKIVLGVKIASLRSFQAPLEHTKKALTKFNTLPVSLHSTSIPAASHFALIKDTLKSHPSPEVFPFLRKKKRTWTLAREKQALKSRFYFVRTYLLLAFYVNIATQLTFDWIAFEMAWFIHKRH